MKVNKSGGIKFTSDSYDLNFNKGGLGKQQALQAKRMPKQELASRGGDPLAPKKLRKSA